MNQALTFLVYVIAIFLALLQGVIIWKIMFDKIDLQYLISDGPGFASLSRFQFLVFTFVIGVGITYLTFKTGELPAIDSGVLTLLGISSASYALGKGIDAQSGVKNESDGKDNRPDTPKKDQDTTG